MTFCTQCGTDNDDSTKYCRECGKRLQPTQMPVTPAAAEPESAETAAGEALYDGFQLYEQGDLDGAAVKCEEALAYNSRSSSAHVLLSMIFEKRAGLEESNGNVDAAKDLIQQAADERIRVLELSPGSIVDAQKLKELRRKLKGETAKKPDAKAYALVLKDKLQTVPLPILASASVTILVFIIALLVMNGGNEKKPGVRTAASNVQQYPGQASQTQSQQNPYAYPQSSATPTAPPGSGDDLQFGAPDTQASQSRSGASNPSPVISTPAQSVPKMKPPAVKLPTIPSAPLDVRIVPLDKNKNPQATKPAETSGTQSPTPSNTAPSEGTRIDVSPSEKTGNDHQREAMKLLGDGRRDEAASEFRRAIEAYNNQIAKGVDVQSANAGIRTCRTFLQSLGH